MEATRRDFLATAASAAGGPKLDAKSGDRSGVINIRDFGAACDGIRNDSPALEDAVNGLAGAATAIDLSQGGTVSFAGNGLQKEFIAEWWDLPYNAGRDAAPVLNAVINAVPDLATIRFTRGGGVILTLASTWVIRGAWVCRSSPGLPSKNCRI